MNAIFSAYRQAYSGLPRATWLVAGVALVNRSGTMVLPFLTLYLTERRGYETATAGLFVMLYGIGGLLGTWMGGRLTDRFGPVRVQTASLLTAAFQFFLLGYWNQTWLIYVNALKTENPSYRFEPLWVHRALLDAVAADAQPTLQASR